MSFLVGGVVQILAAGVISEVVGIRNRNLVEDEFERSSTLPRRTKAKFAL